MSPKSASPNSSAAQLRRTMRAWRVSAVWEAGLAGLCAIAIAICWWLQASVAWWGLSIVGVLSALIGLAADINAYHDTKARVEELDTTAT